MVQAAKERGWLDPQSYVVEPAFKSGWDARSSEAVPAHSEEERGERLYQALGLFDWRRGGLVADVVRAAREGWERSSPEMNESGSWAEFDALIERVEPSHIRAFAAAVREGFNAH